MLSHDADVPRAAVIVVGNEIISGLTQDTNSRFLALKLQEAGVAVSHIASVGDVAADIVAAAEQALARASWVIVTGGLGPTHDDITKQSLAEFFGSGYKEDGRVRAAILEFYRSRGRTAPEYALTQCQTPDNASVLYNEAGTAPGFCWQRGDKKLFAVPGVPAEMEHLFNKYIAPQLAALGRTGIRHRLLKTTGITESHLWERGGFIEELERHVIVASLPSYLGVNVRFSSAAGAALALSKLDEAERIFRARAGDFIYAVDEGTMEETVGGLLQRKKLTLALAESCTGGLIGHRLTNVAGSSGYFLEGCVTYANAAKTRRLGVDEETLRRFGAVSEETARAMALGARSSAGADVGLAVTGIAGPGGGNAGKPVGLTYIALAAGAEAQCERFVFPQDRIRNKERAAQAALNMLRLWLQKA